jgi:glycerate dehydrogenase
LKITVLDGYTLNPGDLSWEGLYQLGEVEVNLYDRTPKELVLERAKDTDIILTNKTPLPEDILSKLPKLRYIGVLATGYDVVDVRAATERNIVVTNIPAYGTDSVAQYVFALLLEWSNHVGLHSQSVQQGDWGRSPDFCYWQKPIIELAGKTMGIVGRGRIGLRTAQIANAFGMKVKVYSRTMESDLLYDYLEFCSLNELLETSDVVSLHCPLTAETHGMINRETLKQMKSTALLINTSRGKLIVEQDLADALNERRLAGAALDVLTVEPPAAESPLIHAHHCIITPHIAWASKEARTRLLQTAIDNIQAFLNGSVMNVVNAKQ